MKTVLHLIETSGPGGAEEMMINIVEHLDQGQYKSIICLRKDGWLKTQFHSRGFETIVIPLDYSLDFRWLFQFCRLLNEKEIDLMHANEFAMNTFGSIASLIKKVPIVTTVHGKSYFWKKFRRRLAYKFVANQSSMVAVSEDIKQFLSKEVEIKEGKILKIHNGINLIKFNSDILKRAKIRSELFMGEEGPIIGTVGNLYPVKGHTFLLRAAELIIRVFPDALFFIAGRGQLLEQLQAEANQLGINNHVKFLGFREDIPALLQACDVFVLPSLSEGLPVSILEAMGTAKPVVATNVGGISEAVVNNKTGFLVPPRNPEALGEKLIFLLNNRHLIKQFGEEGRKRVKKEFTVGKMIEKYQDLYQKELFKQKKSILSPNKNRFFL